MAGIGERVPHTDPSLRRLRRHETVATRARGAVRDTLERADTGGTRAAQLARSDLNNQRCPHICTDEVVSHSLSSPGRLRRALPYASIFFADISYRQSAAA